MPMPSHPKCMTDGCLGAAQWKGLCGTCYKAASDLVKGGKETWEHLIELGLAQQDNLFMRNYKTKTEGKPPE